MHVPLSKPYLSSEDYESIKRALDSGWVSVGRFNEEFEEAFQELTGLCNCVSVNSGTSALFLGMMMMDPQEGQVIVPSFTFPASINAIINAGFRPVVVDVDYETMNLTAEIIEPFIGSETVGILPVHFAGRPCNMASIRALAEDHGLFIVEDCAHGLGAFERGNHVGASNAGCFSFFATKGITTGEGGMVAFSDSAAAERARTFALHGVWPQKGLEGQLPARRAKVIGHNMRLAGILAALGVSQLNQFNTMQTERARIAAVYNSSLAMYEELMLPRPPEFGVHSWHLYVIRTRNSELRKSLYLHLTGRNISASIHYLPALHQHDIYREYCLTPARYPNADRLVQTVLTLPCFSGMTPGMQDYVIEEIGLGISR